VGAEEVRHFVRGVMTAETGIVTLICLDEILPPGGLPAPGPPGRAAAASPGGPALAAA
jgi:hypothetical protein